MFYGLPRGIDPNTVQLPTVEKKSPTQTTGAVPGSESTDLTIIPKHSSSSSSSSSNTSGRTDEKTDGKTLGWTEGWTEGRTDKPKQYPLAYGVDNKAIDALRVCQQEACKLHDSMRCLHNTFFVSVVIMKCYVLLPLSEQSKLVQTQEAAFTTWAPNTLPDGQTERRTERRKDGRKDGQKDGRTSQNNIPPPMAGIIRQ
ncbi:hypothetical protein DPMN_099999 [Dreissena polymorpha]|uniref:Uncharacterized protein n=1 Tax=Dreissena polymorpha TaxID=45954 RepID=A0A9D4LEY8_DREPO|nr:hypothetical protein DPMN_099999 [Dreissena polymorpha]